MDRLKNEGRVRITSAITGHWREYRIYNVSPTTTDLQPIAGDAGSTNVGTASLVMMLDKGTAEIVQALDADRHEECDECGNEHSVGGLEAGLCAFCRDDDDDDEAVIPLDTPSLDTSFHDHEMDV